MTCLTDPAAVAPSGAPLVAARMQRDLVQVWLVPTPGTAHALCANVGVLSPAERRRADAFAFEHDRLDYVCAHVALRFLLASCLRAAPESLCFARGAGGKPRLAGAHANAGLHFNLSHARGLAACAIAPERELGVDVERVDPSLDAAAVAARVFSVETGRSLLELDSAGRTKTFFRLWTGAEAFAKATGMSLEESARHTCGAAPQVDGTAHVGSVSPEAVTRSWRLRALDCPAGYAGAVVAADTDWTLETHFWSWA